MNSNANVTILKIEDTADLGIELTVEIRDGATKFVGVISHPNNLPDRPLKMDRQKKLADFALDRYAPKGISPESIKEEIDRFFPQ